ncbi:filamentous hemagglutinin N-terminal domain-containing protein [Candidatus Albibeggiatoa sp. nov. NOAA]|uniref:two-partner secretion domain-containing protein n=1 Tax=Candidatus Albibeggiatoa sp. nov. NOAA TaxID=3162724 RepID=UPI0032F57E17|nr:filamentous hemagglutinin N-terminal domain-containing protein [Thiotrichaceae bacterium]
MKFQFLLIMVLSVGNVSAEIIFDGTLGINATLPGSDYLIKANLGQQYGGNLFHSFQKFNLQNFESATFSGSSIITNIFARVTSGNPSSINGTIRSTIPNANVYLFNPSGIAFGENAQLDIQGSFHASTADYLRFSDGRRFDAQHPDNNILTATPIIEAFGFISETPASLSVEGSKLIVPDAKNLSFIGGSLNLNRAELEASMGQINLISATNFNNEVIATYNDFVVSNLQGNITLSNGSLIDVSGEGSGYIFIRGGQFFVDNSDLNAKTLGEKNGGTIDMQFDSILFTNESAIRSETYGEGNAGALAIKANQVLFTENIYVSAITQGTGNAGSISIEGNQIKFKNTSKIITETYSEGHAGIITIQANQLLELAGFAKDGGTQIKAAAEESSTGNSGDIIIKAKDIMLADGVDLSSDTYASGQAGNVDIYATGTLTITGADIDGYKSKIASASYPSFKGIEGGNGGSIIIEANRLVLKDGGTISTSSISTEGIQSGAAGEINIRVKEAVELSGVNLYGEDRDGFGSGIYTNSKGSKAGNAGNISLEAGSLTIKDGAIIISSTDNPAKGGDINIDVSEPIFVSGDASQIQLNDPAFSQKYYKLLFSPTQINQSTSGIYASSTADIDGGDAGTITISANDNIQLSNKGLITTEAISGGGGQININTDKLLHLTDGKITTSVQENTGNAGNLDVKSEFVILDNGSILAQANQGNGGQLNITTTGIYNFAEGSLDNFINAESSGGGIDGLVEISSPDIDISAALFNLQSNFVDVSHLELCAKRRSTSFSDFIVRRHSPFYHEYRHEYLCPTKKLESIFQSM